MARTVLLVDDEDDTRELLSVALGNRGYEVILAASGAEALRVVKDSDIDLMITDYQMPQMNGVELCREFSRRYPDIIVVILTGMAQLDVAVEAMRGGAFDFVTKPAKGEMLDLVVRRALEHQDTVREVKRLRSASMDSEPISSIAGASPAAAQMIAMIRRVAQSDATVLITGESGTGKELAARALHELSQRRNEPFVAINCGAVPGTLLESELFGHLAGSFTDARSNRPGLFAQAGHGTIFLDEIGEMPLEMQVKLLRVIQERSVRPVGGDTEVPFHARVITATNRDLATEVEERRFREDLFYRLNVVNIEIPPLRDRAGDVLVIARAILDRIALRTKRRRFELSAEAARRLVDYKWPGNVRELENALERVVAMTRDGDIPSSALPAAITEYVPSALEINASNPDDLISLDELTVRYTRQVLDAVGGNKTHAARVLGIDRRSLYRRLKPDYLKPQGS